VRHDTQLRVSAAPDQLQVAVFKGDVQFENQTQLVSLKKNETLTMDPNQPADYKVTHGTEALPVDAWNKEREAYDSAYAHNAGYGGPRSGYGLQDLNYYGDFFFANGYGYVWQPYGFANSMIGWSPYTNGAWGFVPGFGYTWASGYPWGWLPFHYGSWAFLGGGVGWAWVPGSYPGQWYANNFQTTPVVVKPPAGWQPLAPPATPATSTVKPTVLVGKAAGAPAYIPGGRIPPNFSAVIPGRNVAPNAATPNSVAQHGVFSPNTRQYGATTHTFAPASGPSPSWSASPMGGASIGAAPSAGARSGGIGASGVHGSGGGHGSSGSPK
jgi:hypothetical protein